MARFKTIDRSDKKFWLQQLDIADQQRSDAEDKYEWKKLKDLWNAGAKDVKLMALGPTQGTSGSTAGFVNWVYAFCQVFLPAVYWKQPTVHVYPQKPAYQGLNEAIQAALNASLKQTNFRMHLRRMLQDVLIYGISFMKVGWFTRVGEVPKADEGKQKKLTSRTKKDTDLYLKVDEPYTYRISPEDIYIDPNAKTFEEATWIAQKHVWDLEYVQQDPFLKNTNELSPTVLEKAELGRRELSAGNKDSGPREHKRWVSAYEIWDRETKQVFIYCEGSVDWNKKIPWPYKDIDTFPIQPLSVTENVGSVYPPSVILPWLPLVEELALIRAMRIDHMKAVKPKVIVESGALTADQRKALLDPRQEINEVESIAGLTQFKGLSIDSNLYAAEERIEQNIRDISGYSEVLSGMMPYSRMSATSAAVMERNSTVRFEYYAERVAEFIQSISKLLYNVIKEFQSEDFVIQITGQPQPKWVTVPAKNIRGEYEFAIDVEEMAITSKQQKIKNNFDALQAVGQFEEVQRSELIKDLLMSFGKSDLTRYMKPAQGPAMDPYYENMLMVKGYPVQPTTQEAHDLHLEVHQQFMQTPFFVQMVQKQPAIAALFSEHVQVTIKMYQQEQTQMGAQMKRQMSGAAMQQGRANVTSQPVGRGQGAQLNQAGAQRIPGGGV